MIARKNGAPSMDVMAPTGSADPLPMLLESVSAASKSILPVSADAGMEKRWSCPRILFVTWGHMIPTNPMVPRNDTHTAVISEAMSMDRNLSLFTFTPILFAAESPERTAFCLQLVMIKKMSPATTTDAMIISVLYVARPRSPKFQITAAESPTSVA